VAESDGEYCGSVLRLNPKPLVLILKGDVP